MNNIDTPANTLYESILKIAQSHPSEFAYIFENSKVTYKEFLESINCCAKSLKALGIKNGDAVTIVMPNCPQALEMFYAINCVGGIANMVHPLSSEKEIEFFINITKSRLVLVLDVFANKAFNAAKGSTAEKLIVTSISDVLMPVQKIAYTISNKKVNLYFTDDKNVITWHDFNSLSNSFYGDFAVSKDKDNDAVIIYSGGTTGSPKGIRLTNYAFNALGEQLKKVYKNKTIGEIVYSGLPIYHGFGIGLTCHVVLYNGACCLLEPRFNAKKSLKNIIKHKCTIVAGVPTFFEGLLSAGEDEHQDLSSLKSVFCGGDVLSEDLENRINSYLSFSNSNLKVRVGYGLSESVAAVTINPDANKKGSSGLPLPGTSIKICIPGTRDELESGNIGEICVCSPTTMKGYFNNVEENEQALQKHADGNLWLHTGDLGYIDEDGYLYFVQRLKRMIITSGYNVYPSQLEKIINSHKIVDSCCVIGIPDSYKGQKVKAFVVLKDGNSQSDDKKRLLLDYIKKHVAKYSVPYEIEFRDKLPKTIIGKVDYLALENEELGETSQND